MTISVASVVIPGNLQLYDLNAKPIYPPSMTINIIPFIQDKACYHRSKIRIATNKN